ncbi:unnamed protein product [Albugo candida]|uniref:F-actin-capping protein subunit beta n=1 Tax=Albugo candida TaxID=65357 RepID=A0A024GVG4_9STRA|nr:unnamed protein product [Albugo candida]|eukprot:CCI50768.1 unnamed protein product [Albugo candida]
MESAKMNACLKLMRRMPPQSVEANLLKLSQLNPSLTEELYQRIDQPLQIAMDPKDGRPYLLCDYNRDGDSYRSPWSNEYYPEVSYIDELFYPSERIRTLEKQANELFDVYRELYYQGGVSSAYLWDIGKGLAACVVFKKDITQHRYLTGGSWNSIHIIQVQEENVGSNSSSDNTKSRTASYQLTTSILLAMNINRPALGDLHLNGSLTRQCERKLEYQDSFSHLGNIGRMIEDLENDMRSSLDTLYISKTKEVVHSMRQVQQHETGAAGQNAFVGELASAVKQHRQTPSQAS